MLLSSHAALPTGLGATPAVDQLRAIRRLGVVCNVLCIAAHPDDENTRLLSWLVHSEGVRAAYLSLTRGEGGQNLIGPERAPLLGLIRTQELLAARRLDGAEQFFGAQPDFGYSKSREETLTIWNKEQALGDLVAAIRGFRPDVIVTRFSPDEEDTHGHHSTSAMLAMEAFTAAADPSRFPEHLTTLAPWQATRVVWNWFSLDAGQAPPDVCRFLPIEVGGYDPLLGESYPEIAARSLTMHKTQGFGSAAERGTTTEYLRLLAGVPMLTSPFDGIDRSWQRVPQSEALRALLQRAEAEYALDKPHASVPVLLEALVALEAQPEHPWKAHKRQALSETIVACAAFHVTARVASGQVTAGSRSRLSIDAIARAPLPVTLRSVRLRLSGSPAQPLAADTPLDHNIPLAIDGEIEWPISIGEVAADIDIEAMVGDGSVTVSRPVIHSWIDPVAGERWEPVTVVPAVTLNPQQAVLICPDEAPRTFHVRVRAFCEHATGVVGIEGPPGVRIEPSQQPFTLAHAGAEQLLAFAVDDAKSGVLRFTIDGFEARELVRLDYPHIPPITLTRAAELKVVRFDMARAGDHVGYIAGAGDEVAQALRQVGYEVTVLSDDAIERDALSAYDAIVTGVRAFNTSRRLAALMPRLFAYVNDGGTLVLQYNTNSAQVALNAAIGPYPLTIGDDRVSDENAEMTMCDPTHPVFTRPNRIEPSDFSGWVQERGLCFGAQWDKHYKSLISTHDKGEAARNGALLVATHGSGRVVYTGLAFFRQLPAGVPGAYRLFANLLAK